MVGIKAKVGEIAYADNTIEASNKLIKTRITDNGKNAKKLMTGTSVAKMIADQTAADVTFPLTVKKNNDPQITDVRYNAVWASDGKMDTEQGYGVVTGDHLANSYSKITKYVFPEQAVNYPANTTLAITDLNGKKLTSTDYTIGTDYEYDEENGTVTVSCTAKGNYESDEGFKLEYRVITASQNIAKAKAAKIADQIYTGRAITLTEKDLENILTLNNKALVAGTDFEIDETSYLKNVKKGTATFVVKGIGDSGGVKTLKFKIVQKTIKWNGSYVDGKFYEVNGLFQRPGRAASQPLRKPKQTTEWFKSPNNPPPI